MAKTVGKRNAAVIVMMLMMATLLFGCGGDDGAQGPPGPAGAPGGTSAIALAETCTVCHGINREVADVSVVHMVGPVAPEPVIVTSSTATTVPVVSYTNQSLATLASLNMRVTGTPTIDTTVSRPVVTFSVIDAANRPVTGLTTSQVSMNIIKLVPGVNGSPDLWEAYITGTSSSGAATTAPGLKNNGTLEDIGDGTYRYTFADNTLSASTNTWNVAFEPTLTHRLGIQIGGSSQSHKPVNFMFDFLPLGGTPTIQRIISNEKYCMECHGMNGAWTKGTLANFHGGNRFDPNHCVMCHTYQRANNRVASAPSSTGLFTDSAQRIITGQVSPGLYSRTTQSGVITPQPTDGLAQTEWVTFVHKIHRGHNLTLQNYTVGGIKLNEVTYPQDLTNCRKCHKGDTPAQLALAPQANNWKTRPSQKACGSCHDSIAFQTPPAGSGFTLHSGGVQANDLNCDGCHPATGGVAGIEDSHITENFTPNNPAVPANLRNFTYEISSATVTNSTQPLIKFRINSAPSTTTIGTPVTLVCNTQSSTTANTLLAGFSGSPSFLLAYAMPQGEITAPADYNNLGRTAAQPASVSIANICKGTDGVMTGPDGTGFYTARITSAAGAFPAGSSLRAVALQGYFTQLAANGPIAADTARHTISAFRPVTGDTARRSIIDSNKCSNCHEFFEGHGGNRVVTYEVCAMCHVPNLTSSGRAADPATVLTRMSAEDQARMIADGFNPADPSTYPEETQNLKNLIHGIHSSHKRADDDGAEFRFVRDRGTSGVFYFNFSEVTFPGVLNKCETCHKTPAAAGGYDIELPAGVLATTVETFDDDVDTTPAADRGTLPNEADAVTSPIASVCRGCHANATQRLHMEIMGAQIGVSRGTAVSISDIEP